MSHEPCSQCRMSQCADCNTVCSSETVKDTYESSGAEGKQGFHGDAVMDSRARDAVGQLDSAAG